MKTVIAIDSFKGSMTSMEAGNAAAAGVKAVFPDAEIVVRPLADGAYDVHAVHVGQTEVEDYQVRAVRAYHGERFGAGMRQNDVIAVCSQDRAYEAGDTLFIFYY